MSADINVPRLLHDLGIAQEALRSIDALRIPPDICVSSTSAIKTGTIADALRIVQPGREFDVVGVKVPSGVDEQPLGKTAIDGALNRLRGGRAAQESAVPGEDERAAWFSIENGLFRRLPAGAASPHGMPNLAAQFDPNAEYEDRAVVAMHIPGYDTVVEISPAAEAVPFPQKAVLAAASAPGGLAENTAGSMLAEMGIVADKQNPHQELTKDWPDGPLPRQDQMARVVIRGLLRLAASTPM